MNAAPVVLHQRAIPFLTLVSFVLAGFFVIQAIIVSGGSRAMALLSLGIAAAFGLGGVWLWFKARQSSVSIDQFQFVVADGGRKQRVYERAEITSVDLSRLSGQVRLEDGTAVTLPLEGSSLIEAGVLLTPATDTPSMAPGSRAQ